MGASKRITPKRTIGLVALGGALAVAMVVGFRHWASREYSQRVFSTIDSIPVDARPRVAVVFGAGIYPDGSPSAVLYDRVATAADLYHAGVVQKLLMTGDNSEVTYNEPEAMRRTALALGVPDSAIVLDFAGRRTYDSCFRARKIFCVENAIFVTQRFHLDRALYLGDRLGIECIGVVADRRDYRHARSWEVREVFAMANAWVDVNVFRTRPILGDPEPIDF